MEGASYAKVSKKLNVATRTLCDKLNHIPTVSLGSCSSLCVSQGQQKPALWRV